MTKKRKLYEKIRRGSKNIRFAEFVTLIQSFGFTLERTKGSHQAFIHPDIPWVLNLQPDENGQAKSYQVRQFLDMVKEFNLTQEDE